MFSWLILVAGVASAQDCQPTSSEQLSSTMQQALLDFATLDEESFYASTRQAKQALPCLNELFLPPNAAAYHRLMGLEAFFDGRDDDAVLAFRAALSIEPDYQLSSKLAPEGGKLYRLWSNAQSGPNPFIGSFSAPAGKYAYVDGVETRTYAEDLPNIVQYGPGDGSILWTGYVAANEKPPTDLPGSGGGSAVASSSRSKPAPDPYAGLDDPKDDDEDLAATLDDDDRGSSSRSRENSSRERDDLASAPKPVKQPREGGGKGGLIAATAVSAVAAGGLYYAGTAFEKDYNRFPTRQGYYLTNGSYFGAIGAGVLALTFGGITVFTADGVQVQATMQF